MNSDFPRQKLCEMVARFGGSVSDDPRRCAGLLKDFSPGYRREVAALVGVLNVRGTEELISASESIPQEVLVGRLALKLEKDLGIDRDLARWAVTSWGLALGRFSEDTATGNREQQEEQVRQEQEQKQREQERVRSQQEKEARRKDAELRRIESERQRLEQEAKRNDDERRRLEEELKKKQDKQLKQKAIDPSDIEKEKKRKQRLVGSIAVGAVLLVGGSVTAWNKWQAAEKARQEAILQAEIEKRKLEEEKRQAELQLQQERQRFALQEQARQRQLQEQRQREIELQRQRASLDKQRPPQETPWSPYSQWEVERQRQQQAQIERQRQQQAQFDRQRQAQMEQQRRMEEEQQRRAQAQQQQQAQRVLEELLRNIPRRR
jgi:hypothetical protein